MKDLTNLLQVLAPFITGLLTLWLSNKKSNQDKLDDENDRLSKRVEKLTERIDYLESENDRLRRESVKKDDSK